MKVALILLSAMIYLVKTQESISTEPGSDDILYQFTEQEQHRHPR